MSDFGAMVGRIQMDSRRLATLDEDRIKLAILDARKSERSRVYWFNSKQATFPTVVDQPTYSRATTPSGTNGYPFDLVGIDRLWYLQGSTYIEVVPKTHRLRMEEFTTNADGFPYEYSWYGDVLYLDRNPHAIFNLTVDYAYDLGDLVYTYDGAVWAFYEPDGSTTLTDSYTDEWFQAGERVIRLLAEYLLFTEYLKDETEAQMARMVLEEARADLKSEAALRNLNRPVEPYY